MRLARTIVLAMLVCVSSAGLARADVSDHFVLREWGVRAGGGIAPSSEIQYYAIHPYVGLAVWDPVSRWFDQYGIRALWMLEPWAAYVDDDHGAHQTSSFEIGISAIFFRFVFGDYALRPFLEGGEGAVYTDLRKQDLGTRLQFTSQIGGGLEYEISPGVALGLQVRYRHMSNAGMSSSNPGIDTVYGLLGLTFH
jgi:opacity protein-like surface antigen